MLQEIKLGELVENDYNPRKRFDDARMTDLVESIKELGLLEPLIVRKKDDGFEVVAGIRRLKALREINGKKSVKIPCNIVNVNDETARLMSWEENEKRDSFTPIERARFFASCLGGGEEMAPIGAISKSRHAKDIKEVAKRLKVGAATIERYLPLLMLPEDVQELVELPMEDEKGRPLGLGLGVAEEIARFRKIKDEEIRFKWMRDLAKEHKGSKPDYRELKREINALLDKIGKSEEKSSKELERLQKVMVEKEEELEDISGDLISWANENYPEDEEQITSIEMDQVLDTGKNLDDFFSKKLEEYHEEKKYDEIAETQATYKEQLARISMNYDIAVEEKPSRCPFCYAGLNIRDLGKRLRLLEEEVNALDSEKESLARLRNETEKRKNTLRNAVTDLEIGRKTYEEKSKEVGIEEEE